MFESRIKCLIDTKSKKGMSANVFNSKDDIIGPKKRAQEAVVLIDKVTNEEMNKPSDIRRVSLEYCKDLLKNREPKNGFEVDIYLKNEVHLE